MCAATVTVLGVETQCTRPVSTTRTGEDGVVVLVCASHAPDPRRLALAVVLAPSAPEGGVRMLDWRTDLLTGEATSGLVYEDLDRPGLSIADELDRALFDARAGQAHEAATRG
ncbi:hypothetical protein GCM10017714_33540 [Curtobacterium pusillum]|uniref:Uncharacterized protein n=1 Tax=Curtobacterium pusillum TaxID=69373 RepID=A0ABX2M3K5_9MICO|nr:hypothetical protein [Curtobacterium pusillum]GLK31612.1 hypothetical protein GCM10017610_18970 [Curtobacterium pusillum]